MDYRIVITEDAERDLDTFVRYLLFEKRNEQAAANLLDDFEAVKEILSHAAGSFKECENPRLKELGYRRVNFRMHRYFLLYRIIDSTVFVDNVFHELQDYENKMI